MKINLKLISKFRCSTFCYQIECPNLYEDNVCSSNCIKTTRPSINYMEPRMYEVLTDYHCSSKDITFP